MQYIIDEVDCILARQGQNEKVFAFVDGYGGIVRICPAHPSEIAVTNLVLKSLGSDRRWMEVSAIDGELDL